MKNFELIDRDEALKATSGSIVCNNHIKELPTIITAQQIRSLFNRCAALTSFTLCPHCGMREICGKFRVDIEGAKE